jgi:hypothetical protein
MQQINETKLKVTACVVGVIKKFSKTYGGSILNLDQMLPATMQKLKEFAKANNVSDQEVEKHYRVFVAYNNQLPQILVKTAAPEALANKRLIIRIQKWPVMSPFPYG